MPTKKFQKELNAGTASLVLLSVLSQSQEPMYGYQIAKLLDGYRQEAIAMKQGALYPVLRSLEKNSLLSSKVEPSISGPPRRYYTITDQGRENLTHWVEIWSQMKNFVDTILDDNILVGESHVQ
jgi:PadR family transcriptional regulator PadR